MKSNQLAQVLLAASLSFSPSSQAVEGDKAYKLKIDNDVFPIQVTSERLAAPRPQYVGVYTENDRERSYNIYKAFEAAVQIVASKTQDHTLNVGWLTGNWLYDLGDVEDEKGDDVGRCRVVVKGADTIKQTFINLGTLGFVKKPLPYKAVCFLTNGPLTDQPRYAEQAFTYQHK